MKKILFGLFFWCFAMLPVYGAELTQATIRINRMVANESPLPVLVLFKPTTNGVENKLKIIVGDGYGINSGQLNISTSNLPSGVMPVAGLSIDLVNSNTITFNCNDLNTTDVYGFFITGGILDNPSYDTKWKIETLNNLTIIDQREIKVAIVTNDRVTVTGRVGANASDFQIGIEGDAVGDLNDGDEITYTINYGTYLQSSVKPLKIMAKWSRGTTDGSPSPNVDIVDYVIGSASLGYGGIVPVIDLINQTIEWNVASFPGNTLNETVSFKLKINDQYFGTSNISFEVEGILSGANVVTTGDSKIEIYKPKIIPTLASTPMPTEVQNSATVTISTPTPTIVTEKFKINRIWIEKLSDSKVTIAYESNRAPVEMKLLYGDSPYGLLKTIINLNGLKSDWFEIDNLKPNKSYYFKVEGRTDENNRFSSDVYLFRTASKSNFLSIDQKSIILTVDNNVVLDASKDQVVNNQIILIPNKNYALRVNYPNSNEIKKARVIVRNAMVLGLMSIYGAEPNTSGVDLIEIVNQGYVGHLAAPTTKGYYDIYLRMESFSGHIIEEKIGQMRVIDPLTVLDKMSRPIERAEVLFYKLNLKNQLYEILNASTFGINNPMYTENDGKIQVVVPNGAYRVEIKCIGCKDQTVDFVIGFGSGENMPVVVMEKYPLSLSNWVESSLTTSRDVVLFLKRNLEEVLASNRFFELYCFGLIVFSLLILFNKFKYIVIRFLVNFVGRNDNNSQKYIFGQISDETDKNFVKGAEIYLLDPKNNKILSQATSNTWGYFKLKRVEAKSYKIMAVCEGYCATPMMDYTQEGVEMNNIDIRIENLISKEERVELFLTKLIKLGSNFVTNILILMSSFIIIYYLIIFGLMRVWWLIILQLISAYLWLKK